MRSWNAPRSMVWIWLSISWLEERSHVVNWLQNNSPYCFLWGSVCMFVLLSWQFRVHACVCVCVSCHILPDTLLHECVCPVTYCLTHYYMCVCVLSHTAWHTTTWVCVSCHILPDTLLHVCVCPVTYCLTHYYMFVCVSCHILPDTLLHVIKRSKCFLPKTLSRGGPYSCTWNSTEPTSIFRGKSPSFTLKIEVAGSIEASAHS